MAGQKDAMINHSQEVKPVINHLESHNSHLETTTAKLLTGRPWQRTDPCLGIRVIQCRDATLNEKTTLISSMPQINVAGLSTGAHRCPLLALDMR